MHKLGLKLIAQTAILLAFASKTLTIRVLTSTFYV